MARSSSLSYIDLKGVSHPAHLLTEWTNEAKNFGMTSLLLNLATASKSGLVSNRTVVIRELFPDASLSFLTVTNSNKIKDINENPQVAATLLLLYTKATEKFERQVRFTGNVVELSREQVKKYHENDSLAGQIRGWICKDCKPVKWEELKKQHDEMLKEVLEKGKVLEVPDTLVAYKIEPYKIEFSSAVDGGIADRIVFDLEGNSWRSERTMA